MEQDLRTVLGKTLFRIQQECGAASLRSLCPNLVKKEIKYIEVPKDEQWKAGFLKELLLVSGNVLNVETLEQSEIRMIIDHHSTG